MANPQQPELRRSGQVPALNPNASEAELSAQKPPSSDGRVGDVPAEQRPGHHPDHEQDKPDLDAFAERLGVAAESEEPAGAPNVTDADLGRTQWRPRWNRIVIPAVALVGIALVVLRRLRR